MEETKQWLLSMEEFIKLIVDIVKGRKTQAECDEELRFLDIMLIGLDFLRLFIQQAQKTI